MNARAAGPLGLFVAAAILTAGCATSTGPDPPDPEDIPEYKPRTNPFNVLWNVAEAYEKMDDEPYLDCLAEDFIFFLNPGDLNGDPQLPEYWDKTAEIAIHESMFGEGTDVQGVALVFTHDTEVWHENGPDPLDDTWTFREDIDLRVELPPDLTLHADAPAEFLFRVDPDTTGPNGEVLWEIWKQWDLNAPGRDEREDSSWGLIKSRYR